MNRDPMSNASFVGLELLATAVVVVDRDLRVSYVNPAAESLLDGVPAAIGADERKAND